MANRHKHLNQNQAFIPQRCWVGDQSKIIYATREEAELAAKVAEYDHGAPSLDVYKCEYGDHWHLTAKRQHQKWNARQILTLTSIGRFW